MNIVFFEEVSFTIAFVIYIAAALSFFVYLAGGKEKAGKFGVIASIAGFIVHTAAMILRVIESGRLPFSNQFEFASSFTWGIVLIFLIIQFYYKFSSLGAFVMPLAFLMMGYASMLSKDIKPLMPALQSRWLTIHVGAAVISYGSFAVACGLAVMYLLNRKNMHKADSKLPDAEAYDYLSYRIIAFGFLMLTIVIVTGAIWAKYAWSRYWAWDPKETWSLITWLIYSVYLHLRFNRGWRGKPAAWFAVIGFVCVIFTFVGVNILLPGLHSYK
ncbi:MAG: c-type cytochrome biogenesis protein CcsB [Tissierellia bacterium]|jgi:cytochrome c-type biogenesis protein CcsB|nr:c-type cytochrome biogenesis protein CcsB [Tissierellia bacterium]